MRKILLLFSLVLFASFRLSAQNQRVSGTVTGPDGSPVAGVLVSVEGSSRTGMTAQDGTYSVSAPADGTLSFTILGMAFQSVPVSGRTTLDVRLMPDTTAIEDVVVVGYGSGNRVGTSIGSVAEVKGKALENKPTANAFDAIQGRVAGLQLYTSSGEPTAVSSIRLHGVGSLQSGTDPLILLDGAPIDAGVMASLNPNDIETINVLKDASATSIYGARAANGVLYVTSKRGRRNSDAVVTLSSQYGISRPATNKYNFMTGSELAAYQLEYGAIAKERYDEIMASGVNTNWREYLFDMNAPMYQVDLSVSGGSEKTNYFFSGMFMDQKGTDPGSGIHKYSVRMNADTQAKKWLKMGMNLSMAGDVRTLSFATQGYSNYMAMNSAFGAIMFPTYASPYDENGNDVIYIPYLGTTGNPVILNKYRGQNGNNLQFNGNTYIQVTPVKNLTVKSQLGAQVWNYIRNTWTLASSPYGSGTGSMARYHGWDRTFTHTNTIDYKWTINDLHSMSSLAGQESVFYKLNEFGASRGGQTDDRMMTMDNGSGTPSVNDNAAAYGFNSYFGRVEYAFDKKYTADASIRYDASSRFGKNNRGSIFWSVGAGWDIKRESFMSGVDWVNALKFKVSYGTSGNADIGNYASLGMVSSRTYGDSAAIAINTIANPDLGWETQKLLTVGFTAGLWNNRMTLGVDFYNRATEDMLMEVPFPATSGYAFGYKNVGAMYNRGVDFEISGDVVRTNDWLVNVYANFNYNKNSVTKIFNGYEEYPLPNYLLNYSVGHDGGEFYMETFAGIDPADGKQMWYMVDETTGNRTTTKDYNQATPELQGKSRYAPWSGGFGLSASWKGIGIEANFAWNYGKYLINNDRFYMEYDAYTQYSRSKDLLYRWKKEGDIATLPKYGELIQFDSHLMEDASFLRLKGLTLSYDMPKAFISKTGFINGLRVYFTGRNLLTVTKYTGFDPEIDSNLTYGRYPNSRQYVGGITLTF